MGRIVGNAVWPNGPLLVGTGAKDGMFGLPVGTCCEDEGAVGRIVGRLIIPFEGSIKGHLEGIVVE